MASPEEMQEYLRTKVDSDLVFALDESGAKMNVQYNLTQHYTSVRKFAAIADSKTELREALKVDLAIDPAASAEARASLAALVTSWQTCVEISEKERQQRAEAKMLGVPRQLTYTDRHAMQHAFETAHGVLDDRELPSSDYLACKVEEIEQGELLASSLDEVGSKEEAQTLAVQSSLDAAGRLRITRERKKGNLPKDSEELRAKLRIEAVL